MLQNKLSFNQSAVSLEIIGLPDYSNDENTDQISIISQWKLKIIDKPLIEGDINHLRCIMDAFYNYSNFLINGEDAFYESNLIDIKFDNFYTHNILLKSTKKNVDPLNIYIGNAVLADIINCFDQLNYSTKVRKIIQSTLLNTPSKKVQFNILNKSNIANIFLPPIISICSLFLISSTLLYFYDNKENKENNALRKSELIFDSTISINTIV